MDFSFVNNVFQSVFCLLYFTSAYNILLEAALGSLGCKQGGVIMFSNKETQRILRILSLRIRDSFPLVK